jgi:putative inorganic carbon (HCO3(-)) transporter
LSDSSLGRTGVPSLARRFTIWSLATTAACLPLYVVRFHVGPLPTTLLEVLIGITVVGYAATLWAEKRPPAAGTPYDIPIALLLVAGVIGIVVSPDHVRALGIYRAYFLEAIACFYIAVDMLRTREELRAVLLVAAVGSGLMAIGEIVLFAIVLAQHQLDLSGAPAFLNTTPNAVAMYLEPPLAFAIAFTVFPSQPKERWLAAGLLSLIVVAMVLTLSRASYLSMAVLAVVLVLSMPSRAWRFRTIALLALLALVVIEVPIINQRIATLGYSAELRSSIYGQALQMLKQRPIFGAGISGFPIRVAPFRPGNQRIQLYPHDLWLTTWSELGLLGLVSFAVIFFGLLWRGFRALPRATGLERPVLWGAVGALILYLVHGLFDSPYWKNDLSVEFWLLAALQVVAVRATGRTAAGPDRAGPQAIKLGPGDDPGVGS